MVGRRAVLGGGRRLGLGMFIEWFFGRRDVGFGADEWVVLLDGVDLSTQIRGYDYT